MASHARGGGGAGAVGGAGSGPSAPTSDPLQRLERLVEYLDRRLISLDEFQVLKKSMLPVDAEERKDELASRQVLGSPACRVGYRTGGRADAGGASKRPTTLPL